MSNAVHNWEYFLKLYEACDSNIDFLNFYYGNVNRISNLDKSLIEEKILNGNPKKNKDIIIKSTDKELSDLVNKYKSKKLITCRMGCSETSFLLNCYFRKFIINDHITYENVFDDNHLRQLCGMYYSKKEEKIKVHDWWCKNTLELLNNPTTTLTSCYLVLAYDLLLFSLLDFKNRIVPSWCMQTYLITQFEGQKILVVSNGVNSMKYAYDLGLQKMYNITLPNFSMDFCFFPQTTIGMNYPHNNMIETTNHIVKKIETQHKEFDTALLACGSYTAPLINILSKKFPEKNLLYLGSALYTMFGLYSDGIEKPQHKKDFYNLDNFITIPEKCPDACKHIDQGKYWSR